MMDELTKRERETAVLAAHGCDNRQIAVRMKLQESTVRQYMHRVYEKTGADRHSLNIFDLSARESLK